MDDLCGKKLGQNLPVADRLENRVLTSTRSMNISLSSYRNASGIYNKIVKDARILSKFTGRRWGISTGNEVIITPDMYDSNVLQVIMPDSIVTKEQMLQINAARLYVNNTYNIKVQITVFRVKR